MVGNKIKLERIEKHLKEIESWKRKLMEFDTMFKITPKEFVDNISRHCFLAMRDIQSVLKDYETKGIGYGQKRGK